MGQLPSLEYLLECSNELLRDLELRALDSSSRHLKQARIEWDEAVAQRENAGIARWIIENREAILEQARKTLDTKAATQFPSAARKSA